MVVVIISLQGVMVGGFFGFWAGSAWADKDPLTRR